MVRIGESSTYPNFGYIAYKIIQYCKEHTRHYQNNISLNDHAWNNDANLARDIARKKLPRLHALIFNFGVVDRLDSSGLQAIFDASNTLNRYSDHHTELHFSNITKRSISSSLIIAGFGTQPRAGFGQDHDQV